MARLYDRARWRTGRVRHLRDNPLCVECKRNGKVTAARVVDHNPPHGNDETKFFDESTWQSLCKQCHDVKTSTLDGGYGNTKRKDSELTARPGCDANGYPLSKLHHWGKG